MTSVSGFAAFRLAAFPEVPPHVSARAESNRLRAGRSPAGTPRTFFRRSRLMHRSQKGSRRSIPPKFLASSWTRSLVIFYFFAWERYSKVIVFVNKARVLWGGGHEFSSNGTAPRPGRVHGNFPSCLLANGTMHLRLHNQSHLRRARLPSANTYS